MNTPLTYVPLEWSVALHQRYTISTLHFNQIDLVQYNNNNKKATKLRKGTENWKMIFKMRKLEA